MFPCEFCEISKNTFFYRTPPAADYVLSIIKNKKKLYILNFAAGLAKTPNLVDVSETVKSWNLLNSSNKIVAKIQLEFKTQVNTLLNAASAL